MQAAWSNTARSDPPGRLVLSRTVPLPARPDEMTETAIDLSAALKDGLGQIVLVVEPATPGQAGTRQGVMTWVQSTRIGLAAFAGTRSLTAWASSLADGRPLAGVDVELWPEGIKGSTGADGLAALALSARPAGVLVARQRGDLAILPETASWWSSGAQWTRAARDDRAGSSSTTARCTARARCGSGLDPPRRRRGRRRAAGRSPTS
jgi:hypothetical protein